ncbi:choice-of-anchor L domain-containing protein, partial [Arthrospira platensis SPKY1]|nr:choice-of-anchor L domain-containing protein [Arthrospira platensis SPKY1]
SFTNNSAAFSPELLQLANETIIEDVAIFQIDFVPQGDTIMFRYVFASDEYPEFVCSSFNDVFGFFLEGPDPSTGQTVQRNLANVPGTDLPVSINSVNNGQLGSYIGVNPFFCSPGFQGSLDNAALFNV